MCYYLRYMSVLIRNYQQFRRGIWINMPECLLDVCDINHSGVEDYTHTEYILEYIQRISREESGQGKRNKQ